MRLILMIISLVVSMEVAGQSGLNIAKLFDGRYCDNPNASETIISGENLKPYNIERFHSIKLENMSEEADSLGRLVVKDGVYAINKEVRYKGGHLYTVFYQFPPVNSINRYFFYLNTNLTGGHEILFIYIEGRAEWSDLTKTLAIEY